MNEVKKQILNHLIFLDNEDPFHDKIYDLEIKDDNYNTEYVQSAISELVREKVINPVDSEKIGDYNFWIVHRKKLIYYVLENNSSIKAAIIAVATSKEINCNSVKDLILKEAEKFGLKDTDFDVGFPQFYKTVSKNVFDYCDVKIRA